MIRLQSNAIREIWDSLHAELKESEIDLETWALVPREGLFHARSVSDRIFVEGKGVKGIRAIAYPDFEKVAKNYNDYIDDVPGIKKKIRDEVGYNTQFILTLIHYVLEKKAPVVEAEAPEEDEPAEKGRKKSWWARN